MGEGRAYNPGDVRAGPRKPLPGKGAYDDRRPSRYPDVDFCQDPSAICGDVRHPDFKFVVTLFDRMASIESFSEPESKWEYPAQLRLFVDGGTEDGSRLIDAVSSVFTRGCNEYYRSKQTIHYMEEQRRNSKTLINNVLNLQGRLGRRVLHFSN